ncbi:MAG: DUF1648 domain-containing protein [Clostridia bacterium]|nr:DUF1648 domain-containing protein [Clostridia bacterium]
MTSGENTFFMSSTCPCWTRSPAGWPDSREGAAMNKKVFTILTAILALLPVVLLAAVYARLPGQVPMNWGLNGAVSYGPKSQLWFTALLSPLLLFLFRGLPKIDPRKKNYEKFQKYYDSFCLVMMIFLLGMNALVLSESFWPGRISVGKMITVGIGALFVFLGNLMPKVKNNFFMGVRTPWTLSDPDVWNRANRLGGQCFFVCGLAWVAGGLLLSDIANFVLVLAGTAVITLIPVGMSYLWYKKKRQGGVDKESGE